jgi:hypothetical protein
MSRPHPALLLLCVLAVGWLGYRVATGGIGGAYVQSGVAGESPASYDEYAAGQAEFSWSDTIGVWVAALMTLAILSFMYGDNPLYKLAEAIVVGVSAAYWMVVAFWTTLVPNLFGKLWPTAVHSWAIPGMSPVRDPHWYLNLAPLLLGAMLLWRLAPRGAWIARWPLAFIIGTTAGMRLVHFLQADFLSQIRAGIVPLVVYDAAAGGFDFWTSLQNAIVFFGTLAALVYFFFSIEHEGVVGKVSRVGIWVLMITFGASFGFTVMGRIALLANRVEFLFDDWLWLIDPDESRLMW